MARSAVSDTKKKTSAVKGVITQYMDRRNVSGEYVAGRLGITEKTFRSKMEDPGRFSVEQLAMVANILQIPQKVNFFIGAFQTYKSELLRDLYHLISAGFVKILAPSPFLLSIPLIHHL